MLYVPPSFSTDANAPYVGKIIAAGKQGSKVPPGALEYPQREIVNAIAASGQTPTNGDLLQLWKAIQAGSKTVLTAKAIVGGRVLFAKIAAGTYTWVCPADTYLVRIRANAGGAGGGNGNGYAGAGGLGGNYFEGVFDVVPGTAYTITVGAGGAAGSNGGATFIAVQGGGTLAVALGGTAGGPGGNSSTGYVGITGNTPGYSGIVFPHGGFELLGFGAQNGIYYQAGATNVAQGGMGGGSPMLASTTPFPVQNGQFGGTGCGGGGSGGAGSSAGAPGAAGALFIEG